jgi:hypothetical protein
MSEPRRYLDPSELPDSFFRQNPDYQGEDVWESPHQDEDGNPTSPGHRETSPDTPDTGAGTPPYVAEPMDIPDYWQVRRADGVVYASVPEAEARRVADRLNANAARSRPATDPAGLDDLLNPPRLFQTRAADRLWAFLVPHLGAMDAGFVSAALEAIEQEATNG